MATKAEVLSHTRKCRVLLVDDHPIVRQGLGLLIDREADLCVCGEADGAHSAFHAITTLRPDIVVLDISLTGPDGLDVLKEIRMKSSSLPVLILSMHDESIYAERAMRAGIAANRLEHGMRHRLQQRGGQARRERDAQRVAIACRIFCGDQPALTRDADFQQAAGPDEPVNVRQEMGRNRTARDLFARQIAQPQAKIVNTVG